MSLHEEGRLSSLPSFFAGWAGCGRHDIVTPMPKAFVFSVGVLLLGCLFTSGFAAEKRARPEDLKAPARARTAQTASVFATGEALSYIAKLNDLPAGDGALRLWTDHQPQQDIYRVMAQGRTNELVDMLFRVRGTADGAFTVKGLTPISFRFAYTERDRPRELDVRFDPAQKALVGLSKRKDRVRKRSEPAAGVNDPLSALYVLRSRELVPGTPQRLEVFTGKDRYRIVAHVIRRENVLVAGEERAALRLQLAGTQIGDGKQRNVLPEETLLWVSSDAKHVPLKLESLLPFGLLVVELHEP